MNVFFVRLADGFPAFEPVYAVTLVVYPRDPSVHLLYFLFAFDTRLAALIFCLQIPQTLDFFPHCR